MSKVDVDVEQHTFCLETLANELRLDIIRLINEQPMNVTQIAKKTGAERSRVSHALQILRQCHLVETEKKGREIIYKLSEKTPLFKKQHGDIFSMIHEHARVSCPSCKKFHAKRMKHAK